MDPVTRSSRRACKVRAYIPIADSADSESRSDGYPLRESNIVLRKYIPDGIFKTTVKHHRSYGHLTAHIVGRVRARALKVP